MVPVCTDVVLRIKLSKVHRLSTAAKFEKGCDHHANLPTSTCFHLPLQLFLLHKLSTAGCATLVTASECQAACQGSGRVDFADKQCSGRVWVQSIWPRASSCQHSKLFTSHGQAACSSRRQDGSPHLSALCICLNSPLSAVAAFIASKQHV